MFRTFFSLLIAIIATALVGDRLVTRWINHYQIEADHEDTRNTIRGPVYQLVLDLMRYPPEERAARLAELQPHYGMNLAICEWDQFEADPRAIDLLMKGDIAITPFNVESDDTFHFRLTDSEQVLSIGPLRTTPEWESIIDTGENLVNLGILIILLCWVAYQSKRLKRLQATTRALGEGDLSARAPVDGKDMIAMLADSFNSMAKRLQALIEGHKELTDAVSHELRTPIARLSFELEMLWDCDVEEERLRYMSGIQRDIIELDNLVKELLTYARFDRQQITLEPVAIHPWLEDFLRHWRGPNPLNLSFHLDEVDRDFRVECEASSLRLALSNLLMNAARYGNGKAEARLHCSDGVCSILLDDNGPGIPEDRHEEIFRPFVRLEGSRNRETGGTGLGLAIVARIMQRHGGEVTIARAAMGGARFTLRWPTSASR